MKVLFFLLATAAMAACTAGDRCDDEHPCLEGDECVEGKCLLACSGGTPVDDATCVFDFSTCIGVSQGSDGTIFPGDCSQSCTPDVAESCPAEFVCSGLSGQPPFRCARPSEPLPRCTNDDECADLVVEVAR